MTPFIPAGTPGGPLAGMPMCARAAGRPLKAWNDRGGEPALGFDPGSG